MIRKLVDYVKNEEFQLTVFKDRIHILNYEEVLSLEDHLIRIKACSKTILIRGENLVVNKLLDQEILIFGTLLGIEMKS